MTTPLNWSVAAVGEVVTVVRGITFSKGERRDAFARGLVGCLRTSNIQHRIVVDDLAYVPNERVRQDAQFVRRGDVIISMSNSYELVGKVAIATEAHEKLTFGAFLAALRSDILEGQFLYFLFRSPDFAQAIRSTASQTVNIANISMARMALLPAPVPPLAEQRRIVAKIGSLTAKSKRVRESLDHIPRLIVKYKQAILSAAFRGGLTREWRRSHPDVADVEGMLRRIQDLRRAEWETARRAQFEPHAPIKASDEILEIPSSWRWSAAEGIVEPSAEIVYGIVQPGPKLASGVPYIRGTDIENGQIKIDQLLFTSREIAAKYARASLQGGDILLGIIRATKVAIVPKSLAGANITQGTARFRPSNAIRTAFLARWLEGSAAQAWLHSKYRGIDMPGLNLRDVRRLPVPVAPLDEQDEVVRLIGTAFAWIDRLGSETTNARKLVDHLNQAVLAKAFQGELVPQDPSDEPASVLLEKVRAERQATSTMRSRKRRS